MYNAKYHNVEIDQKPNTASACSYIVNWLSQHGVHFNYDDSQNKLLQLTKTVNHEKRYVVDEIVMKHGHLPLRLPPYHPDLNPIELVWGEKGEVAHQNISSSSLEHKELLLRKLFSEYLHEKWKKCCEHVRKIVDKYTKNYY
jgi:hypothetical protein